MSETSAVLQTLQAISDTQKLHSQMLKQIIDAATKPVAEVSPVAIALRQLAASSKDQNSILVDLQESLISLPGTISAALKVEIDRIIDEV